MSRKLAILGSGTSLRFAPHGDDSFEFWAPPFLYGTVPRLDKAFELHDEATCRSLNLWDYLAKIPAPIYMQQTHASIPSSVRYPLDDVVRASSIAGQARPYLTNTPSFMLAFALLEDPLPTEIHLFGVDVTQEAEFAWQRPSCEFFLGVCHGRGIRVVLPSASDLLKTRFVYGYEEGLREADARELQERALYFRVQRDKAAATERAALEQRLKAEGMLADAEHMLKRTQL